jgi:hypothetical protein
LLHAFFWDSIPHSKHESEIVVVVSERPELVPGERSEIWREHSVCLKSPLVRSSLVEDNGGVIPNRPRAVVIPVVDILDAIRSHVCPRKWCAVWSDVQTHEVGSARNGLLHVDKGDIKVAIDAAFRCVVLRIAWRLERAAFRAIDAGPGATNAFASLDNACR